MYHKDFCLNNSCILPGGWSSRLETKSHSLKSKGFLRHLIKYIRWVLGIDFSLVHSLIIGHFIYIRIYRNLHCFVYCMVFRLRWHQNSKPEMTPPLSGKSLFFSSNFWNSNYKFQTFMQQMIMLINLELLLAFHSRSQNGKYVFMDFYVF